MVHYVVFNGALLEINFYCLKIKIEGGVSVKVTATIWRCRKA